MTWQLARVARDGTHHETDAKPLYTERFDEVLSFHPPGLAAVRKGQQGWHIRLDGCAAYDRRFRRSFGFYEGAAAVVSDLGWHHIGPDGTDLYPERYAWCGNFQEGRCSVRLDGGGYLHLSTQGRPAYARQWSYAGDFRGGIAVVQDASGRSTHINQGGSILHGMWYLDLDVFHKGYARARDESGWMHVGMEGRPVYPRRFVTLEPFYNGQARAEREDGGLEVIDETGCTLMELRPALRSEFAALSADMVGYWKTGAICAGVETGLFDALPATATTAAHRCRLTPDGALRLLRALRELRLVQPTEQNATARRWDVTTRGAHLQSNHPRTLADAAIEYGRRLSTTWNELPEALGSATIRRAPDIFREVAEDNSRRASHHRMLQTYALHDYEFLPAALELGTVARLIDAGGGTGALADALTAHYNDLNVTLLDLPQVIEEARQLRRNSPRIRFVGADLFKPWEVEADAVVLTRVLHDWDEQDALRLLKNARLALTAGARLYIVEMILSEDGSDGGLCDLHLLMTTGGRERTLEDYQALLDQAGFNFLELRRIPALPSIIVGAAR